MLNIYLRFKLWLHCTDFSFIKWRFHNNNNIFSLVKIQYGNIYLREYLLQNM